MRSPLEVAIYFLRADSSKAFIGGVVFVFLAMGLYVFVWIVTYALEACLISLSVLKKEGTQLFETI